MEYIFTFTSSMEAIMAEQNLLDNEVNVKVMPLPTKLKAGCGICLRVNENELSKAKSLIGYDSIYLKNNINNEINYERVDNNE